MFNTVILYHYTIIRNNDYTRYDICSAWFLDIVISTCFLVNSSYLYGSPKFFLPNISCVRYHNNLLVALGRCDVFLSLTLSPLLLGPVAPDDDLAAVKM